MEKKRAGGFVPAVIASAFTVVFLTVGVVVTEILDRQTSRFVDEQSNPIWVWIFQGLAPLGQTGLIKDRGYLSEGAFVAFLVGAGVLVLFVFVITWLGARSAGSAFGVLLTTWFAVALSSGLAAVATGAMHMRDMPNTDLMLAQLRWPLQYGYYWGMFFGFFVGLIAMLVWSSRRRRSAAYDEAPYAATGYGETGYAEPGYGQPAYDETGYGQPAQPQVDHSQMPPPQMDQPPMDQSQAPPQHAAPPQADLQQGDHPGPDDSPYQPER